MDVYANLFQNLNDFVLHQHCHGGTTRPYIIWSDEEGGYVILSSFSRAGGYVKITISDRGVA